MRCRVLLVCGSLQKVSANRAALDIARIHLSGLGLATVEDADELGTIPAFNSDHLTDPPQAVVSFRQRISRCDVAMMSCPEYAGAMSGVLKNALDWIVGSGELYTKPVAVLSAGTTGGVHALRNLIQTLTWQGAHVVGQLGIAGPRTKSDPSGRLTDPATITAIERLVQELIDVRVLPVDERLALVQHVTSSVGIETGHIASMS